MVLLLIGACLVLAVATFAATTRRTRIVLGSALFLTACGDFVTGLVYHRYLCATQADSVIYARADMVEGFFDRLFSARADQPSSPDSSFVLDYLKRSQYRWVEGADCLPGDRSCRYFRYAVSADGTLLREPIRSPTRFAIVKEERDVLGGLVRAWEVRIEDRRTGTVMARDRHFLHIGGWLFHDYDDSSRGCGPRDGVISDTRIYEVLRPVGRSSG